MTESLYAPAFRAKQMLVEMTHGMNSGIVADGSFLGDTVLFLPLPPPPLAATVPWDMLFYTMGTPILIMVGLAESAR